MKLGETLPLDYINVLLDEGRYILQSPGAEDGPLCLFVAAGNEEPRHDCSRPLPQ